MHFSSSFVCVGQEAFSLLRLVERLLLLLFRCLLVTHRVLTDRLVIETKSSKAFFIIYFAFSWLGCCMANKKTGHTLPFSFSRWGIIRLDSAVGHRHRRDLLIYATATGCYWFRYIRLNHHRHLIFPPHLFVSGRTVAVVVNHLDKHKRHNKTIGRTDVPCGNMKGETCGCVIWMDNYRVAGQLRQ